MDPDAVDWASIPGPVWYRPEDVPRAFRDVIRATWKDREAGHDIYSAVGNDHAGTLYPAAVLGTDVLLHIIAAGPGMPRNTALAVLLDWWGGFTPEPGWETYTDPAGQRVEIIPAIIGRVAASADVLRKIAEEDTQARGLVRALLRGLSRGWVLGD